MPDRVHPSRIADRPRMITYANDRAVARRMDLQVFGLNDTIHFRLWAMRSDGEFLAVYVFERDGKLIGSANRRPWPTIRVGRMTGLADCSKSEWQNLGQLTVAASLVAALCNRTASALASGSAPCAPETKRDGWWVEVQTRKTIWLFTNRGIAAEYDT